MSPSHSRKIDELNPKRVTIQLSGRARHALADLAASVHFSRHFDAGMLQTVQDMAAGKSMSVDDILGSLPLIAESAFDHIHFEKDDRARKAWRELGHALLEEGFTLTKERNRGG